MSNLHKRFILLWFFMQVAIYLWVKWWGMICHTTCKKSRKSKDDDGKNTLLNKLDSFLELCDFSSRHLHNYIRSHSSKFYGSKCLHEIDMNFNFNMSWIEHKAGCCKHNCSWSLVERKLAARLPFTQRGTVRRMETRCEHKQNWNI